MNENEIKALNLATNWCTTYHHRTSTIIQRTRSSRLDYHFLYRLQGLYFQRVSRTI